MIALEELALILLSGWMVGAGDTEAETAEGGGEWGRSDKDNVPAVAS